MTIESNSIECPNCNEIGRYQGKGRKGNNWTGTSYWYRYCSECDTRYRYEDTQTQTPTIN